MSFHPENPFYVEPPEWGERDPDAAAPPPIEVTPDPGPLGLHAIELAPATFPGEFDSPPIIPPQISTTPTPQPVFTMDPDQQAGYNDWLAAGAHGSPPAWVLEDRAAERRRQELAAAALAQLAQTPIAIQGAFDIEGTGPIYAPPIVDTAPPPIQTASPASTPGDTMMTLEQFAAAFPDLAVNWGRRNDPAYDGEFADWLRTLGSFENYLRQDAAAKGIAIVAGGGGVVTTPPPVPPPVITPPPQSGSGMPPLTITNQTALAHAVAHPDLENNWVQAWTNPAHANTAIGVFIRGFPTFQAYVLDDISRQVVAPPPPATVPPASAPGGMNSTAKGLLLAGIAVGVGLWFANRNRAP
jgi:hypothetical protein